MQIPTHSERFTAPIGVSLVSSFRVEFLRIIAAGASFLLSAPVVFPSFVARFYLFSIF